jgi:isopenicillin N synthase-like dioxygenase
VRVPEIEVTPFVTGHGDQHAVARTNDEACRQAGFFSIVGHGVDFGIAFTAQRADLLECGVSVSPR